MDADDRQIITVVAAIISAVVLMFMVWTGAEKVGTAALIAISLLAVIQGSKYIE